MKKLFLSTFFSISIIFQIHAQWVKGTPGSLLTVGVTNFIQTGSKILAATNGYGILSSADNGGTWTKTSYPSTYAWQVASIANEVVAGSWNDGVYYSADNGGSWTQVNTGLTDKNVNGIAIIGSNIIATTGSGVFKSSNKGISWVLVNPIKLGVIINNAGKLYSSSMNNIMVSSDLGVTWTTLCASPGGKGLTKMLFNGTDIYVIDNFNLYKSTTNGSTWSKIYSGGSNDALDVAVSGSLIVLAAYNGALSSSNDGANWTDISTGLNVSFYEPQTVFYTTNRFFVNVRETGIYYRNKTDLVSLTEQTGESLFNLYPNPAIGSFNLDNANGCELRLMNSLGEIVLNTKIIDKNASFDVSGLKTGIYIANILSNEKSIVKQVLIK